MPRPRSRPRPRRRPRPRNRTRRPRRRRPRARRRPSRPSPVPSPARWTRRPARPRRKTRSKSFRSTKSPAFRRAFFLRYSTPLFMHRRQFLLASLLLAAAGRAAAQPALKPWAGVITPPLELSDTEGKTHRLADYRGKTVLVNFWATWCEPCREEMPSIERLRTQLQRRPFAVLAVNVGQSAEAARAFAKTMPLGFPLLLDRDMRTSRAWGARVLPATFLIGP